VLSLENFPNSESKEKILRFVSKNAFGKFSRISFKKKLSLENFPNSGAKSPNSCFFQNLRTQGLSRVWRIFQTQVLSLENSPNSDSAKEQLAVTPFCLDLRA